MTVVNKKSNDDQYLNYSYKKIFNHYFPLCICNFKLPGKSVRHLQFFKCSVCHFILSSIEAFTGILFFLCHSALRVSFSFCFIV